MFLSRRLPFFLSSPAVLRTAFLLVSRKKANKQPITVKRELKPKASWRSEIPEES
jgi:hypothetical protein